MNSLKDILLLPGSYFKKLNDKKPILLLGVAFIGLFDIFSKELVQKVLDYTAGIEGAYSDTGILLLFLSVFVVGALDIFIFSVPMFVLFWYLKKEQVFESPSFLIMLMKTYITAHLPLIPFRLILYYAVPLNDQTPLAVIAVFVLLEMLLMLWFSGIISRGVNAIYEFRVPKSYFVFFAVFLWNYIWGMVLATGLQMWLQFIEKLAL